MADFQGIAEALIKGQAQEVKELVQQAVSEKSPPGDILTKGLIAGMSVVGKRFKSNEIYVPEVLIAARAMHAGMNILKPLLIDTGVKPKGAVAIGTVKGDLHDIGKNLVMMMIEGAGFNVIDLGVDVPIARIADEAVKNGVQLVGLSALLTTTMLAMEHAINEIKKRDQKIKVMVGGAPLTIEFAEKIGADGFAPDALRAIDLAKNLINIKA